MNNVPSAEVQLRSAVPSKGTGQQGCPGMPGLTWRQKSPFMAEKGGPCGPGCGVQLMQCIGGEWSSGRAESQGLDSPLTPNKGSPDKVGGGGGDECTLYSCSVGVIMKTELAAPAGHFSMEQQGEVGFSSPIHSLQWVHRHQTPP